MDENPNRSANPLPAVDEDWSGRVVGEFQVLRSIGRGGMGQVFLAEQTSLKRKVAIKMLRPELAANRTALLRFRAEAEAVARLNHPNIVQIYAVGEQDGVHYMALEYVEGRNLRDYLNRKGTPDLLVCLSLMRQIASALQKAHDAGFVHRDVKPENILLTRKGEAKVTDFGLSRCFADPAGPMNLTQSGVAMGTPLYMSPEQVQGKPTDPRTDIYSYGVTCFHLFSGSPPFRGAGAFDVAVQHVQSEPPNLASIRPDLPADLRALIHRMMAKDPEARPQSFKDVLREINRIRESVSGAVSTVPLTLPAVESNGGASETKTHFSGLGTWRNPRFSRWVVAVAIASVFVFGMTVRLVRHRVLAKEPSSALSAEKMQPIMSGEERFALDAAKRFADPASGDFRELKPALDFQIELAVYYLKQNRLDDADAFFRELIDRKYKHTPREGKHPFRAFGELGQGLVLVFRDDPRALDHLGKLVQFPSKPTFPPNVIQIGGVSAAMFDKAELRRLIGEALNRLALNLKVERFETYPALNDLRRFGTPGRLSRPRAPG